MANPMLEAIVVTKKAQEWAKDNEYSDLIRDLKEMMGLFRLAAPRTTDIRYTGLSKEKLLSLQAKHLRVERRIAAELERRDIQEAPDDPA